MIEVEQDLIKLGRFVLRRNRFVAEVAIDGIIQLVHVPNSGRMKELLVPDSTVGLISKPGEHRKTKYQLTWVLYKDSWVNIDSSYPNKVITAAIKANELADFAPYEFVKGEISIGKSRLDLLLARRDTGKPYYIETKSVTLVEDGVAKFPDAPTIRGSKHVRELSELVQQGIEAGIIFVVQRTDAKIFCPNWETDPQFALYLEQAAGIGVKLYAFTCQVELGRMFIYQAIPISLTKL